MLARHLSIIAQQQRARHFSKTAGQKPKRRAILLECRAVLLILPCQFIDFETMKCRALMLNLPCQFTDFFVVPFLRNEYEMK